ncbi:MAG: hypothetical protein HN733_00570 [Gammaproteobacteria bacterium]|nr:hypothetical protein [Gammaproteobacteria bacterium]
MEDIFKDIKVHSALNQKLWNGDKLRPEVRKRLLKIASEFIKELDIPVSISDVTFTGSLANFNYSKYSDIDLHLILDFSKINKNEDLVRDFLLAKKSLWNDEHDIFIRGSEVEVYAENIGDPHHSTGVYSVLNNEWIKKPDPGKSEKIIDYYGVINKSNQLIRLINSTLELDSFDKLDKLELLKDKIKKMRQCGLEKEGEFSIENLAYKLLRNKGYIKKLWDESSSMYDELMSMENVSH